MEETKEKKSSWGWLHLLWILPLVIIIGGGAYLFYRFKTLKEPQITDVKITFDVPQKGDISALAVKFSMYNPNNISAHIDSVSYKIYIDNNLYVEGRQNDSFTIKANDTTHFILPAKFDFKKFVSDFNTSSRDSGMHRFEFDFYGDIWKINDIHFPYSTEKKMAVFKPLDFKVEKIKLKKPGLKQTKLEALMTLENPNSFGIVSSKNYYEFYVEKDLWMKGNLAKTITIPPKSSKSVTMPLKISPKEIVKKTGIFGQKDYQDKNFRATLQTTIKKIEEKNESAKPEESKPKNADNFDVVLFYDGKLGPLVEEVKEKKQEGKKSATKKRGSDIKIIPARRK